MEFEVVVVVLRNGRGHASGCESLGSCFDVNMLKKSWINDMLAGLDVFV